MDAAESTSPIELIPDNPDKLKAQLAHDVAQLGSWPIVATEHACPVLSGTGVVRWREYRWCTQKYVDRAGELQEKKVQVFQDCTGTRQEFLATFKRKLLTWLPHRQQLQWDRLWQRKKKRDAPTLLSATSEVVTEAFSDKVKNMCVGEVDVRIDFIKNAELRSPNQAQREYFIHQYLSLLCTVVQWKTVNQGVETLHTHTNMFCSDDRKHDGVFAAHCLRHLAKEVALEPNLC